LHRRDESTARRRRAAARFAAAGLLLGAAAHPGDARAHALSPSLLVVHELAGARAEITWKTPVFRVIGADLRPALPPDCARESEPEVEEDDESFTATWTVACTRTSWVGQRIGVDGLASSKTDALLRVELADGRTIDTVLRASEPYFVVPARERRVELGTRYAQLGFDHILSGYDHLLFVLGLLLLVTGRRALVATVSAFTLGHSITLTLAVLDLARVPPAPVEALIALSIFLLATELARPAGPTLMRSRPWLVAALFGLLHGLGFAGSLRAAGLPASGIPLALFSFNVGIELGQLAFVLAVEALGALARATARLLGFAPPAWGRTALVYALGSLAAMWTIERTLPLLSTPALALAATFAQR
jgi:hypothetical protein